MCKYACTHAFQEPAEGIYLDMPFYATPIEYDGTPSLYYILLSVNQIVHPSVNQSIKQSIHPSVHPSTKD